MAAQSREKVYQRHYFSAHQLGIMRAALLPSQTDPSSHAKRQFVDGKEGKCVVHEKIFAGSDHGETRGFERLCFSHGPTVEVKSSSEGDIGLESGSTSERKSLKVFERLPSTLNFLAAMRAPLEQYPRV